MSLHIGIDSGTQSTKAVVLDLDSGAIIAKAQAPHRLIGGLPPGHMEQHPREWVEALEAVLASVTAAIDRSRVRGIGVSGQQHGFVPLDGDFRVIRPAKLWCDTSTAPECALLTRRLGGAAAVIRKTGIPFLPGYTAPKILWLKRHEPANFRRLRHILLPHDYLNLHLTGRASMEYGDASGTALMDVRRRTWSSAVCGAIDRRLSACLPPLSASHKPAGILRPELAEKFGLPPGVVVSAGGGDNMMGAIGTGNVRPGVVTASLGTSGTIYAFSAKPVTDPRGEIAAFCSSTGGWLPLLCTMNVTTATGHMERLLGLGHAAFDAAVQSAPPGAGGLLLLPYLEGERTPCVPGGSGVLLGLTGRTFDRGHLARAAMEGATLGMNYGLRRLAASGVRPKEIRVTGGGARSAVWRQVMADIFGVPVVGMVEDEGAALGAALQAAWTATSPAGSQAALAALCGRVVALDESSRLTPDAGRHAMYCELQDLQDRLGTALRGVFPRQRAFAAGRRKP